MKISQTIRKPTRLPRPTSTLLSILAHKENQASRDARDHRVLRAYGDLMEITVYRDHLETLERP